jgi:hypothetical protein
MQNKTKKNKEQGKVKARDLKPSKDAKGGGNSGTHRLSGQPTAGPASNKWS